MIWTKIMFNTPVGHLYDGRRGLFFGARAPKKRPPQRNPQTMKCGTSRNTVLAVVLALVSLSFPVMSFAQQPAKVYRIGWLSSGLSPANADAHGCPINGGRIQLVWREGLRERGYVPGQNLIIECRYTQGRQEAAPALATELVSRNPDLIVADGTNQVRAVKQATSTIPILMLGVIEPVRRGLVASLARPGGNVTGVTDTASVEVFGKYVQLLKEAVPAISRVAVLGYSTLAREPSWSREVAGQLDTTGRALDLTLQRFSINGPEELNSALIAIEKWQPDALLEAPHPFFGTVAEQVVEFAARNRLPTMFSSRRNVELGGLMAYTNDELEPVRRLAVYADRILKGAKPGDIPVEQPTKYELLINLKTARALGLTIPGTLMIQVDEIIQ